MKVRLYTGLGKLAEKSGVGQALHHQEAMLKSLCIEATYHNASDAELVHINTVFPDAPLAAVLAHLRGQKTAESRSIEKTGQALLAIYRSQGVKVRAQETGRKRHAAGFFV